MTPSESQKLEKILNIKLGWLAFVVGYVQNEEAVDRRLDVETSFIAASRSHSSACVESRRRFVTSKFDYLLPTLQR